MNDTPQESLPVRYLMENPWPLGLFLILLALVLAVVWNNRGGGKIALAAGVALALGVLVFLLASIVTTPGEHARALVRGMVAHAVAGDADPIIEVLAPDATLHLQSLKHPGRGLEDLEDSIRSLEDSNRITHNTITKLRAWTTSSESALVFLGCRTTTESSWGPVPSTWVFQIERSARGNWRVKRIAFVSLAGRQPSDPLR